MYLLFIIIYLLVLSRCERFGANVHLLTNLFYNISCIGIEIYTGKYQYKTFMKFFKCLFFYTVVSQLKIYCICVSKFKDLYSVLYSDSGVSTPITIL